ncbi:MAG: phosphatidate cytidylyltransferase [Thermoanaerobaculales bacterium]|nr:phosphatidate cytidylyltransferase [Thermoanaerobaculales bacterium]
MLPSSSKLLFLIKSANAGSAVSHPSQPPPQPHLESPLFKRELFAFVAGPLVLAGIIWAPSWVFVLILSGVVLVAGDELLRMAQGAGVRCGRVIPLLALALLLGTAAFAGPIELAAGAAVVILLLPVVQLLHPDTPQGALTGMAVGVFSVLYLGFTCASLGWLRTMPTDSNTGVKVLLLFMLSIWIGDSGAYYVGKNLGRHRMSPRVSPKKTWEGLAGGIVATFMAAVVFNLLFPLPFAWFHIMAIAGILSVAAPVGDLIESLFKRDTGVKDSSSLIPGHGGLLDRTDSLLFAAPLVLAYLLVSGIIQ